MQPTADADAVVECWTNGSIIGFSLDVVLDILVLELSLSCLALLSAGGCLLGGGLLALFRSLGGVLGVRGSAGGLGRQGDVVLRRKTRVTLGTGPWSVTCQATR